MSKLPLFATVLMLGAFSVSRSGAQSGTPPQQPQHEHSMQDMHHQEVSRGDMAMGFSHMKTTHHFRLSPSGGSIEVQANDPTDTVSRDQIRRHLEQLPKSFKAGNFSAPVETHGRVPPGVPTMQELRSDINYKYVQTDHGGKVLITTESPDRSRNKEQ